MPRITRRIDQRKRFYILTNGKETEKNYFNLLKSKKSIYDVRVIYFNGGPKELVEESIKYSYANQVWCVFDIDNSFNEGNLINALSSARKNGISIAFSNKAFEVWLINHFKVINREMNNEELINELNETLKKEGILNEYKKNDEELLKKIFIPRTKKAIENAKIIYQRNLLKCKEENSENKIWEWNPCTNVYQLIEALKFEKL